MDLLTFGGFGAGSRARWWAAWSWKATTAFSPSDAMWAADSRWSRRSRPAESAVRASTRTAGSTWGCAPRTPAAEAGSLRLGTMTRLRAPILAILVGLASCETPPPPPPPPTPGCGGLIAIPPAGPANPYPSTCSISGLSGAITDVNLVLNDLIHTWPDDVDILLVGPQGQNAVVMSDAGDWPDAIFVDLTLDDQAATVLPVEGTSVRVLFASDADSLSLLESAAG